MIGRPRPRVEGRPNARFAGKSIKSQAPKDARLVPQQMSQMTAPRSIAAKRMMNGS